MFSTTVFSSSLLMLAKCPPWVTQLASASTHAEATLTRTYVFASACVGDGVGLSVGVSLGAPVGADVLTSRMPIDQALLV
jgi:hypothetical protein